MSLLAGWTISGVAAVGVGVDSAPPLALDFESLATFFSSFVLRLFFSSSVLMDLTSTFSFFDSGSFLLVFDGLVFSSPRDLGKEAA